jgi:uncharacterized membrane protein
MRRLPALPERLDVTLAYKTICLTPDLSSNEKRVAAAILDHFNHKTGQCDPGFDRLARLLHIARRSVVRAIDRLADLQLFYRVRFGGRFNRNSYEPNWRCFREFEATWKPWFAAASARTQVTILSPFEAALCPPGGDSSVTQTSPINNSKGTSLHDTRSTAIETKSEAAQDVRYLINRAAKKTSKPLIALHASAERRIAADLLQHFHTDTNAFALALESIDVRTQVGATEAELRKRGAGLLYILDHLAEHLSTPIGPSAPIEVADGSSPTRASDGDR